MNTAGKLAASGVLAGLLAAMTIAACVHRPSAPPIASSPQTQPPPVRADLAHCRAITMPETGCEAAWEAERRHFFGRGDR